MRSIPALVSQRGDEAAQTAPLPSGMTTIAGPPGLSTSTSLPSGVAENAGSTVLGKLASGKARAPASVAVVTPPGPYRSPSVRVRAFGRLAASSTVAPSPIARRHCAASSRLNSCGWTSTVSPCVPSVGRTPRSTSTPAASSPAPRPESPSTGPCPESW